MGSPGAGRIALLEATARGFGGSRRLAALAGDLATERDADRLRAAGIPSCAITTGQACHLDADMVHRALHRVEWSQAGYLFIENVGNLVCPASTISGRRRTSSPCR
jgi:hydrogenase nickel incorporation protein HypB